MSIKRVGQSRMQAESVCMHASSNSVSAMQIHYQKCLNTATVQHTSISYPSYSLILIFNTYTSFRAGQSLMHADTPLKVLIVEVHIQQYWKTHWNCRNTTSQKYTLFDSCASLKYFPTCIFPNYVCPNCIFPYCTFLNWFPRLYQLEGFCASFGHVHFVLYIFPLNI